MPRSVNQKNREGPSGSSGLVIPNDVLMGEDMDVEEVHDSHGKANDDAVTHSSATTSGAIRARQHAGDHGIPEPTQKTPSRAAKDASWPTMVGSRDTRLPASAIARAAPAIAGCCRSRRTATSLLFSPSFLWTSFGSRAQWIPAGFCDRGHAHTAHRNHLRVLHSGRLPSGIRLLVSLFSLCQNGTCAQ